MRNSSLVDVILRRQCPGLNMVPKLGIYTLRRISGRGAFYCRSKSYPRGAVDEVEVRMPELVTKNQARNLVAESLRFPEEG